MASIFDYKPLRMPTYVVFVSGLVELAATFGVFVLSFLLGPTAPGLGLLIGLTSEAIVAANVISNANTTIFFVMFDKGMVMTQIKYLMLLIRSW